MSVSAHTPRPWDAPKATVIDANAWAKLHCNEPMQFVTVGFDGWSGETVAIVYGDDDAQELANAHLISAAPDLLEALLECLPYVELDAETLVYGEAEEAIVGRARAAIAKARGLQS